MKPTYEELLRQLKITNYKLKEAVIYGRFESYQEENIQGTINQAENIIENAESNHDVIEE